MCKESMQHEIITNKKCQPALFFMEIRTRNRCFFLLGLNGAHVVSLEYLASERANINGLTRAPFKNFDPVPQTAFGGFASALRSRRAFSLLSTVILSPEEKKAFLLCLFLLNVGLVILHHCRDRGNIPLLKTLTFLTLTPHKTKFPRGIFPPMFFS